METLKAGLIGCGRMGAFTSEVLRKNAPAFWFPLSHLEALSNHSSISEIAVTDENKSNLDRAREVYDIKKYYLTTSQMLEEFKPDLLAIATRTKGRADLISKGIDSGSRAFHVEKPLCNSVKELAFIESKLKESNIFATYGAIRRFMPVYRNAVKFANSGQYGKLIEVKINFGSGMLFWTHPHAIDLILFAASGDKVVGVQASLSGIVEGQCSREILSDPIVISATIYFESGLVGCITQSHGSDMILTCEGAEIGVRADGHVTDIYVSPAGKRYPEFEPFSMDKERDILGGTYLPINQLVQCLRGDLESIKSNLKNKNDMLLGQKIIFAMAQSHLENSKIIDLNSIDPQLQIAAITNGKYA
ncbi:Gfo/Idh/MocA family oxidoreductase [Candidatus Methylopumilus universalis]|uniref:Gfo/Idh/MocA family protein n=1 Tax=Candidatus Methylopumilus universalis TaxID=2588536 RepID=UPI00111E9FAD|nr:Gfo/Idh/MocA family oxidoreductase [Candidatus Methylopumilus universalis]QDC47520.1 Gfo/Idh/MocA family oxidoreductase [Candidatus Methylopumilus universalis]QDC72053.1 Gfo/Idh/MocA family oxidoreductase [Candidatus Methylopumilus universalis]